MGKALCDAEKPETRVIEAGSALRNAFGKKRGKLETEEPGGKKQWAGSTKGGQNVAQIF